MSRRFLSAFTHALAVTLAGCGGRARPEVSPRALSLPESPDSSESPESSRSKPARDVHYRIAPGVDLHSLEETLCFRGAAPSALIPGTPDGLIGLTRARLAGGGDVLAFDPLRDKALALSGLPRDACVSLSIRLPAEVGVFDVPYASRAPDAVILPVGFWLWRPALVAPGFSAEATLELAPGMDASVAWAPGAELHDFLLPSDAFWRSGLSGWATAGSTAIRRVSLGEDVLEIVAGPPELLPEAGTTTAWLEAAAREMLSLFGHFRGGRLQVVLRGVPALEAVPFGQTYRGGGAAVALLVSTHLDAEAARADWVAVHEIFHTGLPAMRPEDAWLFEGLASYYQNVLRVRSGRLTPAQGWAQLSEGFARGASAQTGRTLADESRDMHRTHAYWSVYWGGALWALRTDLALRALRPGSDGLDDVVRRWFRLEDTHMPRSAEALMAEADTALGLDGRCAREAAALLGRTDFLAWGLSRGDEGLGTRWQTTLFPRDE